jgi:hypothetical protein
MVTLSFIPIWQWLPTAQMNHLLPGFSSFTRSRPELHVPRGLAALHALNPAPVTSTTLWFALS